MSNNDWVQEGTPRDEEWTAEEDDYGVPVEPAEWDDYASEQTVPVPPAPAQPEPEVEPELTADGAVTLDEVAPDEVEADVPAPEDRLVEEAADERPIDDWRVEEHPGDDAADEQPSDEWAVEQLATDQPAEDAAQTASDAPVLDEEVADEEPDVLRDEPAVPEDVVIEEPLAEEGVVVDEPVAVEDVVVEPVALRSFGRPVDRAPSAVEDDSESTRAMPVIAVGAIEQETLPAGAGAGAAAAGTATLAGLYRGDRERAEETRVIEDAQRQSYDDEIAEEERQAHQLQAEKEARDQRLGLVQTSNANAVRDPSPLRRRGVGHFASFGLFVLRLVMAAILGVVGYQVLSDIDATTEFLSATLIPEPRLVAWIVGFGLAVIAVLLVIGLAVRVAGLLVAVVAGGSLAFIRWGQFSPFVSGMEGFLGDRDLLIAAVGILLFSLGGGRWGIDGAFVKARETAREAKH